MRSFKSLNLLFGWLAFAIAAVTYLMCIEPTASLWDCGEFISSAYKLEVGHPPGAPLFIMMARFFAIFAPGVDKVAMMVNAMSALASAFTILFLFWSITHLFCKMLRKQGEELNETERILAIGAGLVGALAYTFSDTFWFSAVEGEVYATSSLFTAVVFWAILKWENVANEPYANRWIVLIAYLVGLSIGVHLLNLLAIPAIVMVYYFKKYKVSKLGIVKASLVAILLLGLTIYGIVPLLPWIASGVELMFVNGLGMPINSGLLFYIALLVGIFIFLIRYTLRNKKVLANTIVLCVALISLGYGSYAMIVIRSSANPPMDQNNPDNIFSLMSYLNRDQYGSRPLLYGQYYNAPVVDYKVSNSYVRIDNKYVKADNRFEYVYDKNFCTILPRIYNDQPDAEDHRRAYQQWGGTATTPIVAKNGQTIMRPTFGDNLSFLFSYQISWMYWRYFMWNFSGRQNDLQGHGGPHRGNWITGITPLDEARLGTQDPSDLPEYLANNKGHNKYYMLPLLLGIFGALIQLMMNRKDFVIVLLLFFFTGLAIVLYLNQTPYQPRERDYAYAGSFYAFAIWIGLGVVGLYTLLRKLGPSKVIATASVVMSLFVPTLMAAQNWDDHDRSGRYITSDFGYNLLNSCLPNSIIVTYGDNDTFALWYEQEVESERTDVRVANISYLYSDWYYEQMMRRTYSSDRFVTSATPEKIAGSRRNSVPVEKHFADSVAIGMKDVMDFIMNDSPDAKTMSRFEMEPVNYIPAKNLALRFDASELKKTGVLPDSVKDKDIINPLILSMNQAVYGKNSIAVFDIVANNYNTRPIYFGPVTPEKYWEELTPYAQAVGLARIITPAPNALKMDIDKTFDLFMNTYRYRGLNDSKIYSDETLKRMTYHYRTGFIDLATTLVKDGQEERAKQVIDKCITVLPEMMEPYAAFVLPIVNLYANVGEHDKAQALAQKMLTEVVKELKLYQNLSIDKLTFVGSELYSAYRGLQGIKDLSAFYKYDSLNKEASEWFTIFDQQFGSLLR